MPARAGAGAAAGARKRARGCCRSARACSCWPRQACSTASAPPPTGATASGWPSAYPAHRRGGRRAVRRRGQSADGCRERRPASTSACTSSAATGAPRLPTASPAGWWCRHIATAARRSSSRHRYRRRGKGDGSAACSTVCAPSPRAIRASPAWPGRLGMSRRTFLRRFKAGTGATPGVWLVRARLARARHLLETTHLGLDDVATAAGFRHGRQSPPSLPQGVEGQSVQFQAAGSDRRRLDRAGLQQKPLRC